MSSNHLMYDTCAYEQKLNQSTGPGNYMMYPGKYNHCQKCRNQFGLVSGNDVSIYDGNMVDLESDLYGINRPASLCNKSKYHPKCKNCGKCKNSGIPCGCLACTSKNLIHQPNCQMIDYKPVVTAPPFTATTCDQRQLRGQIGPVYQADGTLWDKIMSWF